MPIVGDGENVQRTKEGRRKGRKKVSFYLNLEINSRGSFCLYVLSLLVSSLPTLFKPSGKGWSLTLPQEWPSVKCNLLLLPHFNGPIVFYWADMQWALSCFSGPWTASIDCSSRHFRSLIMLQEVIHDLCIISDLFPFLCWLQWTMETFPGGLGGRVGFSADSQKSQAWAVGSSLEIEIAGKGKCANGNLPF